MTSWRAGVSVAAQADLDGLLSPALGFAKKQLEESRAFYPFAIVVDTAGEMRMLDSELPVDTYEPAEVIESLLAAIVTQRRGLRAAAIVSDVAERATESAGVRVTMEQAEGVAIAVLLPYTVAGTDAAPSFGDLRIGSSTAQIWSAS